jgi:hypothetical protein
MIEEDAEPEQRELDVFKLTAPPGVRSKVSVVSGMGMGEAQ